MGNHVNKSMCRIQRFARIAVELAGALDNGMTHQLCALVLKKNRVLAIGYNSRKTSPIMQDSRMQMQHAESHAITRCRPDELQGADIIIARCRPSGKPGLAKPCEICERILRSRGVRRVFYTINSENSENPELGALVF